MLKAHEPFPALAVDRHWQMVAANAGVAPLLAGVAAHLLAPPVNVLRLSLHPEGVAPRIVNLAEWRAHIFHRLEAQIEASADPVLADLLAELRGYPGGAARAADAYGGVAVPLVLRAGEAELSFLSTTTMFGTPIDITLAELAIEAFLPADARTADYLMGASLLTRRPANDDGARPGWRPLKEASWASSCDASPGTSCRGRDCKPADGKKRAGGATGKCARPALLSGTMWTPDTMHGPCQSAKCPEIRAFHG